MTDLRAIRDEDYALIKQYFLIEFGIVLSEEVPPAAHRKYIELLAEYQIEDVKELISLWKRSPKQTSLYRMLNIFTVNHTSFFRERAHFNYLRETFLPRYLSQKAKKKFDVKIWSAASSTGEEAYSLAFLCDDYFRKHHIAAKLQLLATDIDLNALRTGRDAVFHGRKLAKLPPDFVDRYFVQRAQDQFSVVDKIKKSVTFRWHNLAKFKVPKNQQFDIIFCRNVMLYLSETCREQLFTDLHATLKPDGTLFIGHSETGFRVPYMFERIAPSVYRKRKDF